MLLRWHAKCHWLETRHTWRVGQGPHVAQQRNGKRRPVWVAGWIYGAFQVGYSFGSCPRESLIRLAGKRQQQSADAWSFVTVFGGLVRGHALPVDAICAAGHASFQLGSCGQIPLRKALVAWRTIFRRPCPCSKAWKGRARPVRDRWFGSAMNGEKTKPQV